MKKIFIFLTLVAILLLVVPSSAWVTGEGYRKSLNVTGNTNWYGTITNYSMPITIYRSSGTDSGSSIYLSTLCNANYSDIRVTDTSDTSLPYWIETSNSSQAYMWVRVPSVSKAASTGIYIYYNNTTMSSLSNPNTTWDLYDDFNGASLNASKWTSGGSGGAGVNVTVGSGVMTATSYYSSGYQESHVYSNGNTYGQVLVVAAIKKDATWETGQALALDQAYYTGYSGHKYKYSTNLELDGTTGNTWYRLTNQQARGSDGLYYATRSTNFTSPVSHQINTPADTYVFARSGYGSGYYVAEDWIAVGKGGYGDPTYSWSTENSTAAIANFTANATIVAPGANVSFTDSSTGSPDYWWWDTNGDGVIDNTTQNATRVYSSAGVYTVSLTVQKYGTNNTLTRTNYISVGQAPVASFSINKTSGTAPVHILVNDTSTLNPTWFNWSWGEGGANTTTQNATHTYTSSGSYIVIFSAANAYGSSSSSTTVTVLSAFNATGYGQYYASKTVTMHITSAFGQPISGATVTMQGVATSSGSWDWLGQLLGIRLNETPVNTAIMTGTTDTNGDVQFLVLPTVMYNISIYKEGEISKSITLAPSDDKYTIPLDWNIFGSTGNQDILGITTFNVTNTTINATTQGIVVTGTDTRNHLTGGTLYINQTNTTPGGPEITVYSQTLPIGNFTITVPITDYKGKSYFVRINATQSDVGNVKRDYGVSFPKDKVNPAGLSDYALMLISVFILIGVGAIFTQTTAAKGTILVCFIGWILYGIGWMNLGGATIPAALILGTVVAIAANVLEWRNGT